MLKFLLIFFITIYILGYLGKLFLARWIKKVTGEQMHQNAYQQKEEGEVTIKTNARNSGKNGKDKGEYVDYEELKD